MYRKQQLFGDLGEDHTDPVEAGDYRFPSVQIGDLAAVDRIIRPLCDQARQMFGREGSPNFNVDGAWIERGRWEPISLP
jgi:hypothetical protein